MATETRGHNGYKMNLQEAQKFVSPYCPGKTLNLN